MDVVRFKGGLGNQMFQYCLMKALQSRGRKVCVDLGFYESHMDVMPFCLLDVFKKCKIEEAPNGYFSDIINRWKDIKEDKDKCIEFTNDVQHRFFWGEDRFEEFKFIPSIFETQECTFVGYWQNEGYFKDIVNTILQDFTFSPDNELEGYGDSIKNLTSVHVRRGDYTKHPEIYDTCSIEYYKRAIERISELTNVDGFVFFSDDIKWVKEHLPMRNAVYVTKDLFNIYEDWYDMYLMSRCRNNIIANSTFSWWGAWLNSNTEKYVIAPQKWTNKADSCEVCPTEWIILK